MKNKDDLIELIESLQAGSIRACQDSIDWIKQQPDLDTSLNDAPADWWSFLIACRVDLAEECEKRNRFNSFLDRNWFHILRVHPQLVKYCEWLNLPDSYKKRIIKSKPEILKYINI
tara:strand:+ start:21508 stop:21855 length:348 start_codon:yes stop_codon:yes gene_type:complete